MNFHFFPKKIFLVIFILIGNKLLYAQPTHGLTFQLGLVNSLYKSTIPNIKNVPTIFIPSFAFEYGKYSDNLFWGGAGIGMNIRNIPFYKYNDGNTIGVRTPEFWAKVKTGFHIHNEFMTHLPFIALGVGKYAKAEQRYKNQNGVTYTNLGHYKNFNLQSISPFLEIGTSLINSSFVENKRNIFLTFSFRYYPLNVFKSKTDIEYAPFEIISIQYQLIELNIIAGIQQNFRKN